MPKMDLYRFDAVSVLVCIDRCTDERQPDVPCELSIIVPLECSSLNWDGLIGLTGVFSVCKNLSQDVADRIPSLPLSLA
jgi:hypothetical protein